MQKIWNKQTCCSYPEHQPLLICISWLISVRNLFVGLCDLLNCTSIWKTQRRIVKEATPCISSPYLPNPVLISSIIPRIMTLILLQLIGESYGAFCSKIGRKYLLNILLISNFYWNSLINPEISKITTFKPLNNYFLVIWTLKHEITYN